MPLRLTPELMCEIIRLIVDTPAVFIFDVSISDPPYPPILPQSRHFLFVPCVSPPLQQDAQGQSEQRHPGTYESPVSKTIRSLLLTDKAVRQECLKHLQGIPVDGGAGDAIVRFNPRRHTICLQRIHIGYPAFSFVTYRNNRWADRVPGLSSDLRFDIDHLAFMYLDQQGCIDRYHVVRTFRRAFPTLQNFCCAVVDPYRTSLSEPLRAVYPDRDPAHGLSPVFVFMMKRYRDLVRRGAFVFTNSHASLTPALDLD
ncbi:hypothetical protein Daus18300_012809 [Diaporthe australafricana]|uniref:Uncharacterized protein n=1 Tax=Diaporthe australafricana TaxID=127596 RepID=A0ABR3W1E2_9PEZI